jgi:Tir chaperone protein (CesT) family
MVKNMFEALLDEIGHALGIPDLHSDQNSTCLIKMPNGISIQLEMHARTDEFLIGADLGQVPPGRYREDFFHEALKANGKPFPQHGILAYSSKTDHLVIYELLNARDLTGGRISEEITPFVEKALTWKSAIENGEIPSVGSMRTSMGMFGLR